MSFKVVVLGESSVGKTCLIASLHDRIPRNGGTIGADFSIKCFTTALAKLRLVIWDTAGQERYICLNHMHTRDAEILVICYDVSEGGRGTIVRLEYELLEHSKPGKSFLIVGCKKDLGCDADTFGQADTLAQAYGAKHLLVSNKTGEGIAAFSDELAALGDSFYLQRMNIKSSEPTLELDAHSFQPIKDTPSTGLAHIIVDGLGLAQIKEIAIDLPYSKLADRALQAGPAKYKLRIRWRTCHAALLPPFLYVYTSALDSRPKLTTRIDDPDTAVLCVGDVLTCGPLRLRLQDAANAAEWATVAALSLKADGYQADVKVEDVSDMTKGDDVSLSLAAEDGSTAASDRSTAAVKNAGAMLPLAPPAPSTFQEVHISQSRTARLELRSGSMLTLLRNRARVFPYTVATLYLPPAHSRILLTGGKSDMYFARDALIVLAHDDAPQVMFALSAAADKGAIRERLATFFSKDVGLPVVHDEAVLRLAAVRATYGAHVALSARLRVSPLPGWAVEATNALLEQRDLRLLNLRGSSLDMRMLTAAVRPLIYCKSLTTLLLRNTSLNSEHATYLASHLPSTTPALEELDLAANPLGAEGLVALRPLFTPLGGALTELRRLNVMSIGLGDADTSAFLDVALLGSLSWLSLAHNCMADTAARVLTEALRHRAEQSHETPLHLDLTANMLSAAALGQICSMLQQLPPLAGAAIKRWTVAIDGNPGAGDETDVLAMAFGGQMGKTDVIETRAGGEARGHGLHVAPARQSVADTPELTANGYVFISYAHADVQTVGNPVDRLCEALRAARLPYWRDVDQIRVGRGDGAWGTMIAQGVRQAAAIVVCLSDAYFESEACRTELALFARRVEAKDDAATRRSRLLVQAGPWDWRVPDDWAFDLGGGTTGQVANLCGDFDRAVVDMIAAVRDRLERT